MTIPGRRQGDANDPDDGVLVQRSQEGDRGAFETLVLRHQGLVFRIVGGFLRNRADVEEVAQEVFVRAFTGMPGFRPGAPFGPWIAQIATRASYDRLRRRRRASEIGWEDLSAGERRAAEALAEGKTAEDHAAARDLAERALSGLPVKDRQALLLADGQGLTAGEVAQAMGCSALAVRLRLHRARRAMRRVAEGLLGEGREGETGEGG